MEIEPIWRAPVQQGVFRRMLDAMAYPGRIQRLEPSLAAAGASRAVLAALLDGSTSLADPHGLLPGEDWPMLQARRADAETAAFVLCDGKRAPDFEPRLGELVSPELGATLVLRVGRLGEGGKVLELSGPGVRGKTELRVAGLNGDWLARRAAWVAGFPLGVDVILADRERLAALPRTTAVAPPQEAVR